MKSTSLARPALIIVLITGALLLLPLIAMQFTTEVRWGVGDFIAAGVLLFVSGMAYVLAARQVSKAAHRILVATVVLLVLGLIWAELAVGLFD